MYRPVSATTISRLLLLFIFLATLMGGKVSAQSREEGIQVPNPGADLWREVRNADLRRKVQREVELGAEEEPSPPLTHHTPSRMPSSWSRMHPPEFSHGSPGLCSTPT